MYSMTKVVKEDLPSLPFPSTPSVLHASSRTRLLKPQSNLDPIQAPMRKRNNLDKLPDWIPVRHTHDPLRHTTKTIPSSP
jgi:hypothetical protein